MGDSHDFRRFAPLRRSTRASRIALFLVGPLLWIAALVGLGFALDSGDAVETGLLIAAGSFVAATAILVPTRMRRVREEGGRGPAAPG